MKQIILPHFKKGEMGLTEIMQIVCSNVPQQ